MNAINKKTNYNQYGFTLLEIMLVILLMGVAASAVVMTMPGQANAEKDPKWQAQRFITILQFAEDEALISGLEIGIVFDDESYQFTTYDHKKSAWIMAKQEILAGKRTLSAPLKLEYKLSGSVWDQIETEDEGFIDDDYLVKIEIGKKKKVLKPQVYVMSSGEVTPFTLRFLDGEDDHKHKKDSEAYLQGYLSVNMSGSISRTIEKAKGFR
ncbi:MAG TPA: type II secretion system protein GspH [Psychromonas hadalis]|nr:type II secretion system protein GspH [Psychromonas hadalis]